MNTELIEKRGTAPLLELLNQFGGWPVLLGDKWIEKKWDWLDVLKRFRQTGLNINILFSFIVTENLRNSSIRSIDVRCLVNVYREFKLNIFLFGQIDQTKTDLPREYLIKGLDEDLVKAYYDFMIDIAVILGAERKQAENELLDALNFEIALANVCNNF